MCPSPGPPSASRPQKERTCLMMSRRLSVSLQILALALACGVAAVFAADPPIPIGVGVAQNGPAALAGPEHALGAQLAEEEFNKQAAGNGPPINLGFQDAGM